MYAKTIALSAARTEALIMKASWEHLAYRVATTAAECYRASGQAARWDLVAQDLGRRVQRKSHGLVTRADIKAVADALVVSKLEIAFKVDHG